MDDTTCPCEHNGCNEPGIGLWLPNWNDEPQSDEPDAYYCEEHMRAAGWCPGCYEFWGGIESFDFSTTGYCENCEWQLRDETGDYDDDFDPYEWAENM